MATRRSFRAYGQPVSLAFDAITWNDLEVKASHLFQLTTVDGTRTLLTSINQGLAYADNALPHLATEHAGLVARTQIANDYLLFKHVIYTDTEQTPANANDLDNRSQEIETKAVILKAMRNRRLQYESILAGLGEIRGKLESLSRVALSLLSTQEEQSENLEKSQQAALKARIAIKTGIAINCVDSEWPKIQNLRRNVTQWIEEVEGVVVGEFLPEMTVDGQHERVTELADDETIDGEGGEHMKSD